MANDNTLNVEITASVAGLKQGLTDSEKALKTFSNKAEQLTSELKSNALESAKLVSQQSNLSAQFKSGAISADKYQSELASISSQELILSNSSKKLSAELLAVNRSAGALGNGAGKMGKSVKVNATPALQEFSRVVQDAPFGIMGVGNNIQQLTANFGYLSKSAGGSKAALKAMVGALAGPGGVLLAVSAVTTILTVYGSDIADFIKGTDNAKKSIEYFDKAIGDLDVTLSNLKLKKKIADIFGQDTTNLDSKKLTALKAQLKLEEAKLNVAYNSYKIAEQESKSTGLLSLPTVSKSEQKGLDELARSYNLIKNNVDKARLAVISLEELLSTGKGVEIFDPNKVKSNAEEAKRVAIEPINALLTEDIPKLQEASYSGMGVDFWQRIWQYEELEAQKEKVLAALNDFNSQASSIIQSGIINTFAGIGEGIGNALATGVNVLKSAGGALLSGLGGILVSLGEMAIKTGVGLLAIKLSLETLGGFGAIAAGIALVALGSSFSSKSKSLGNSMGSGGGSSDYSSGGSGGSSIGSFSSSSSSGGTYVFEIAGTKLIGVLKNTLDRNRSLGGSNNLIFN